jgi:hypothetical protein
VATDHPEGQAYASDDVSIVPGMTADPDDEGAAGFDVVRRGYDRTRSTRTWPAQRKPRGGTRGGRAGPGGGAADGEEARALRSELERGRPSGDRVANRVGEILALAEAEAEEVRKDAAARAATATAERDRVVAEARAFADGLLASARRDAAALVHDAQQRVQDAERAHASIVESLALAHEQLDRTLEHLRRSLPSSSTADKQVTGGNRSPGPGGGPVASPHDTTTIELPGRSGSHAAAAERVAPPRRARPT